MNATLSPVARIAGVAIVLILAATLGLVTGNALNARDAGSAGGPGPFPNVWGNVAAPSAADADPIGPETYGNIAASPDADPIGPETYGNIAASPDADPVGPETYGNIAEDQSSAGDSVTAPTLR